MLGTRTYLERRFHLWIGDGTRYSLSSAFGGRALLAPGGLQLALAGVVPAQTTRTFPFALPAHAGLVGVQITAQAATGAVGGPLDSLSLPSLLVIAP